jgi:hypothetical protein
MGRLIGAWCLGLGLITSKTDRCAYPLVAIPITLNPFLARRKRDRTQSVVWVDIYAQMVTIVVNVAVSTALVSHDFAPSLKGLG